MATINLLSSYLKQPKRAKREKIKLPQIKSLFITIPAVVFLLLAGILGALLIQVKFREKTLISIKENFNALKINQQKIDELTKREKELSEQFSFFEKILEENIIWSAKLNLINKNIPKQIWLTSASVEKRPVKTLVLRGSATSLIGSEMIDSIAQFAAKLKEDAGFQEIKLGPLVIEKTGKLNIMNFSITCKLK